MPSLLAIGIAIGVALLFLLVGDSIVEDVVKGVLISGIALLLYWQGFSATLTLSPIAGVVLGTIGNAIVRTLTDDREY